jgi:hypothetical protein
VVCYPSGICFFEMGAKRHSLCIKMMHTTLFIKLVSKVFKVLLQHHHGYVKVAAKMSQRKKEQAIKFYATSPMHLECNQPPWLNIARTTAIK